jgi:hypothetical protein
MAIPVSTIIHPIPTLGTEPLTGTTPERRMESCRVVDPLLAERLYLCLLKLVALALLEVRAVEDRRAQVAEFNYRDAGSIYGIYSEMAPMQ